MQYFAISVIVVTYNMVWFFYSLVTVDDYTYMNMHT